MKQPALTEIQLAEWRAGETRRNQYWDRRIAAYVSDAGKILSPAQIKEYTDYWAQWNEPVNPAWAAWYYRANGIFKPQYIPSNIYYGRITRALNRRDYLPRPLLQDKNYLDVIFPDILRPEVIVRNIYGQYLDSKYQIISQEEAIDLCMAEEEVILKPTIETMGARNIEILNIEREGRLGLRRTLDEMGMDFIVQKLLCQHSSLAALNPDSVNTLRVLSLLWNDEVIIVGALVRIGSRGVRVDNLVRSNGISCALDQRGRFVRQGYDKSGKPYLHAPNGIKLEGYQIPGYKAAVRMVKEHHPKLAHFKLIGWDITITEEENPVLIETNLDQPDLYFHQFPMGPLFGDGSLLEEILRFTYEQYPMYWT